MSLNDDLYKEIILEHSQNPSHRHAVSSPTVVEEGVNRSCGDEIEIQLKVENGKITDVGISGQGCSISTASSSLMADAIDGLSVEDARLLIGKFKEMIIEKKDVEFTEEQEDIASLAGVQKYPVRVKCATLPGIPWNRP